MDQVINILVGGPISEWPDQLTNGEISGDWIAVDKGAIRLLKMGITPKIAVGDFDSTVDSEMQIVKSKIDHIEVFPPEKDFTDTQIGVMTAMKYFPKHQIDIYGATGGRIDHLLANLFLSLEPRFEKVVDKLRIIDQQNTIRFYQPGEYEIIKEADKKYLAFVSLTAVDGLTMPDEKYTLQDFNSSYPISWASNEFSRPTNHFSFKKGIVAVVQSKD